MKTSSVHTILFEKSFTNNTWRLKTNDVAFGFLLAGLTQGAADMVISANARYILSRK